MSSTPPEAYEAARASYDEVVISHGAYGYRAGHHDAIVAAVDAVVPIIRRQVAERVAYLEDEIKFWKDQYHLAANVAATIADLDEVAPALRQLLRQERARRKAVEDELVKAKYELQQVARTDTTEDA